MIYSDIRLIHLDFGNSFMNGVAAVMCEPLIATRWALISSASWALLASPKFSWVALDRGSRSSNRRSDSSNSLSDARSLLY